MNHVHFPAQKLPLGEVLFRHDTTRLRIESVCQNGDVVTVKCLNLKTREIYDQSYEWNEAVAVELPEPIKPRGPDDHGYLESDRAFFERNQATLLWLLEKLA